MSTAPTEYTGPEQCVYSNKILPDAAACLAHMETVYGLYVPDKEYLVDVVGYIRALAAVVWEEGRCLNCGLAFQGGALAVQQHMRDKSHIQPGAWLSHNVLSDFYDFRPSYPDYVAGANDTSTPMEDDADWQDEDGVYTVAPCARDLTDTFYLSISLSLYLFIYLSLSLSLASTTAVTPAHCPRHTGEGPEKAKDVLPKYKPAVTLSEDGMFMTLPDGRIAVHKTLARYAKQRPTDGAGAEERAERARRIGWTGGVDANPASQNSLRVRNAHEHLPLSKGQAARQRIDHSRQTRRDTNYERYRAGKRVKGNRDFIVRPQVDF